MRSALEPLSRQTEPFWLLTYTGMAPLLLLLDCHVLATIRITMTTRTRTGTRTRRRRKIKKKKNNNNNNHNNKNLKENKKNKAIKRTRRRRRTRRKKGGIRENEYGKIDGKERQLLPAIPSTWESGKQWLSSASTQAAKFGGAREVKEKSTCCVGVGLCRGRVKKYKGEVKCWPYRWFYPCGPKNGLAMA